MSSTVNLSVLLSKSGDDWTARCLEYDVAGQGETIPEAMESLGRCLALHILQNLRRKAEPFFGIPEAPPGVWKRFNSAKRLEGEEPLRMPSRAELPPELQEGLPELAALPRPRASEMRVC
jgi:hypothetical protein